MSEEGAGSDLSNRSIKITPSSKEGVIVVREGGQVEVYMALDKVVERGQLLVLGLMWALENEEWKVKLMRRARERLLEEIEAGEGEVIEG
jgi:hypothetical protein